MLKIKLKKNIFKIFFIGKLENSTRTVDLNSTSISLDENHFVTDDPIDKTMSQICENQSRADQMIESCSKIVPEPNEADKNMSTLFTQTADSISVADLLDLCSGSFVTQAANYDEPENYETQVNCISDNDFSDDEIGLPKKLKHRKKVNISGTFQVVTSSQPNTQKHFTLDDEDADDDPANIIDNDESNISKNDRNESGAEGDNLSEDEEEEEEEEEQKVVEYDSEENEIEVSSVNLSSILASLKET